MDAIESGKHQEFNAIISKTGNTVCGRHPIGIVMAALEILEDYAEKEHPEDGRFKFVKYDRSSLCQHMKDSSVSYCSAYAILRGGQERTQF
jgi:predicted class III extradiol MEMO1 family dioxygenase